VIIKVAAMRQPRSRGATKMHQRKQSSIVIVIVDLDLVVIISRRCLVLFYILMRLLYSYGYLLVIRPSAQIVSGGLECTIRVWDLGKAIQRSKNVVSRVPSKASVLLLFMYITIY
jgi:hypothetical protein